jgi:peptidoglycan/LPS O-acetylase OafA/YrhL
MLSHSWTLLLEGEGYILAAFFAALVPVSLFTRGGDDRLWRRYRKACIANLRGNLLVAMLLLTAACYEAVEVITMMRMSSLDC